MNYVIWGLLSLTEFISRIVTPLLIGWAHTQNDLCIVTNMFATIGRQSLKWGHRSMRMLGKVSCRWTIYFLIHSSSPPEQNGRHSQTTFSNAFSWIKIRVFWFNFHWILFLWVQLTIRQHWSRWWLGAEQVTSHYPKQCWPTSLAHLCGTRGSWVN